MPLSRGSSSGPASAVDEPLARSNEPARRSDDAVQKSALKQAVFLHTGWRSAGTWVWSRLRELDAVTGFYEPLSNVLAELSLADVSASRPTLTSGHPPLAAPYFDEYRPFLQEGARGVAGYRKHFSIDRFASVPDAEFAALQAYLRNLCERTVEQAQRAGLQVLPLVGPAALVQGKPFRRRCTWACCAIPRRSSRRAGCSVSSGAIRFSSPRRFACWV